MIPDNASVDRLPSFITGPQPQISSGPGGFEMAAIASASRGGGAGRMARAPTAWPRPLRPSDDFNPGNE